MCVYLAPRWRRRSFVLTVVYTLLLLWTTDARALRDLGTSPETWDAAGSGSNAVSGGVTGFSVESSTPMMTRAWNSGSFSDGSELNRDKSVTFGSLLMGKEEKETGVALVSHSSSSAAEDHEVLMTPSASSSTAATSNSRCSVKGRRDHKNENIGHVQLSDEGSKDVGSGTNADSKLYNDGTIGATGTTNEAPRITPPSVPTSRALPPHHEALSAKAKEWSSSFSSSKTKSTGRSEEASDSADVLENSTKSASSTVTSSSSFDQTLVVVIIGVVGAIGAFLLVVSRKVLQETGDDDDSEDSSLF
uniref:RxLR effector candidate protein n=1 Tax=Hyaloperonospora arabidopsidis (strain Emoy2) TaxID=559515 RepID=M4BVK3_HYAAE|nr:RxLR effector candidate protein [Hyaloperonospora arabidopsidis Emoy2]